jgi:hypothetical protein
MVEHILLRTGENAPLKPNPASGTLQGFEASPQPGHTFCLSSQHNLTAGTEIRIFGSDGYDGIYTIVSVQPDRIEIEKAFAGTGIVAGTSRLPQWARTQMDIRDWVFTSRVESFAAAENPAQTQCHVPQHGLLNGQTVEIVGTDHYNGTHIISTATPDSFLIERAFSGPETQGRWKPIIEESDPFSLQLTFLFPDWTARYQNGNFRQFVENMVREETPAHLTPYVQWLSQTEMQAFDQAYHGCLTQLSQA